MQSNLYLSDDLYVELNLDREYLHNYYNYTITVQDYLGNTEQIFNGRIYYYKTGQRIYLNDIISTHAIDYAVRIPTASNVVGSPSYVPTNTNGVIQTFIVTVTTGDKDEVYTLPVLSYYKDLDLPKGEYINVDGTQWYNMLEQRTKVLPTIPKLDSYKNDTPGFSNNFFFSVLWIPSHNFVNASTIDGRNVYKLVAKNKDGRTLNYIDYDTDHIVHSENFDGYDLSQLTSADPVEIGICGVTGNIDSEYLYKKVANVDLCPADYYLIWYDRTGAYQCQPFSKKAVHSENITSNNLVSILEETIPYEKIIEDNWRINSDWLTEDQYKAYESILTSPYLYLYDSKLNCGWWVVCTDKTWTQKTHKNHRKLFNLTVNVKANKKQRLVY